MPSEDVLRTHVGGMAREGSMRYKTRVSNTMFPTPLIMYSICPCTMSHLPTSLEQQQKSEVIRSNTLQPTREL